MVNDNFDFETLHCHSNFNEFLLGTMVGPRIPQDFQNYPRHSQGRPWSPQGRSEVPRGRLGPLGTTLGSLGFAKGRPWHRLHTKCSLGALQGNLVTLSHDPE